MAVRRAAAEMQAHGVSGAGVCRALERAVTGHPACARFDRMMIMTGESYSRTVIATMQEWAQQDVTPDEHHYIPLA